MAATGTPVIGRMCRFYYDADGSISPSATWVEVDRVQGTGKTSQKDVAEIKERELLETIVLTAHKGRELTIQLTRRPGDSDYEALQDAYENDTKIAIAMATGDITETGQRAFICEAYVTGWDSDQSHDASVENVTFRPAADYTTAPDLAETA